MKKNRTRWSDTQAAKNAATEQQSQTWHNYVKIESLLEVPFTIVGVEFEASDFEGTEEQVVISLTYDSDDGTEDEGVVYELTTTRNSIMRRMRDISPDDLPIGPVTVYETGKDRRYGTTYYSIGETVPEIDATPIVQTPVQRVQRDIGQDRKRQELSKQLPKR